MLEQDVADLQERLRAQVLATGEEDDGRCASDETTSRAIHGDTVPIT